MTSVETVVKNPANQLNGTSEALCEAYGISINEDERLSTGSETRMTFRRATARKAKRKTKLRNRYTDKHLILSQTMRDILCRNPRS
jgi:hypothetical protein